MLENEEVSMVDVLDEDNELEAEANAVLGDSDDQNCTYNKGYVNRQALYACLTCVPAAPEVDAAGVCLACSLACHDSHELVELYTKRNFRCDCGNKKFGDFDCKLHKDKEPVNEHNKYNQNFKGVYCSCSRPYPDPDDEIEDEMIQCVMCEDWFHSRHLRNLPPMDGEFSEMICDLCMDKFSFLKAYIKHSVPSQQIITIKKNESDVNVDVESINPAGSGTNAENRDKLTGLGAKPNKEKSVDDKKPVKRCLSDVDSSMEGETSSKKVCPIEDKNADKGNYTSDSCSYKELLKDCQKSAGCTYWKNGWRSNLCPCDTCMQMYKTLDVAYLLDKSDTISAYEDRGKTHREKQSSSYDSGLDALGNLDRVQQIEILHGYNEMKTELTSFLAGFAQEGKTVKEEDIRSFFQNLKNKRKNTGSGNFQHFCR